MRASRPDERGRLMSVMGVPRQPGESGGRLDIGGLALVTPAVIAMVYGLSQPGTHDWGSAETLLPLLGGSALLILFGFYELRQR